MTSLWVIYRTVNFPYFYSRNYSLWLIRGTVWIQIYHKPLWAYSFENQGPYTLADRGLFAKRSLTFSSRSVYFQPGPYTLCRTDINGESQLLHQWRNYSKPVNLVPKWYGFLWRNHFKRHNIKFNKTYNYTCQNQSGVFDLLNDY